MEQAGGRRTLRRALSWPLLVLLAGVLALAADTGSSVLVLGALGVVALTVSSGLLRRRALTVLAPTRAPSHPPMEDATSRPLGCVEPATAGRPQPRAPGAPRLLPRTA